MKQKPRTAGRPGLSFKWDVYAPILPHRAARGNYLAARPARATRWPPISLIGNGRRATA